MNVKEMNQLMENATLFELHRLFWAIDKVLSDAQRIDSIKRRLRIGQQVSFFSAYKNQELDGSIVKLGTRWLSVKAIQGGIYETSYGSVNLDKVPIELPINKGGLTSNNLAIGQTVGFWSERRHKEIVGEIIRLNSKTATLDCGCDGEWRVGYRSLYLIIEGELSDNAVYLPANG